MPYASESSASIGTSTQTQTAVRPSVTFHVETVAGGADGQPSEADLRRMMDEQFRQTMEQMADPAAVARSGQPGNVSFNFTGALNGENPQVAALLERLLMGNATRNDFTELATRIEQHATSATVEPRDDGSYVLTAQGVRLGAVLGLPPETDADAVTNPVTMAVRTKNFFTGTTSVIT